MAKCFNCECKIQNIYICIHTCRCKNIYCKKHLHNHDCSYDYNQMSKNQLTAKLPVVDAKKLETF